MAEKEEIEILISPEGAVKFQIKGIKGPACVNVAKTLAAPLGEIKKLVNTSEYYQKTENKTEIKEFGQSKTPTD